MQLTSLPIIRRGLAMAVTAVGLCVMLHAASGRAWADDHFTTGAPIAVSPSHATRLAVIVISPEPGAAQAPAPPDALRGRLQELGFKVLTVDPSSRPDLAAALRRVGDTVSAGSEVAAFFIGAVISSGGDLYVLPTDSSLDVGHTPGLIGTEGVAITSLMRRVAEHRPAEFVAIIDACRPMTAADSCNLDALASAGQASLIATEQSSGSSSDAEGAQTALLQSMTHEDEDLPTLARAIQFALPINGPRLRISPALSTTFRFQPKGFFASLAVPCNGVDAAGLSLPTTPEDADTRVAACREAGTTWPYADRFKSQLAAALEQASLLHATAQCNGDPGQAYLAAYPSGQFREQIETFRRKCSAAAEQARAEARQHLQQRMDDLIARGAPEAEFLTLGLDALHENQGPIAFRAFDEANPSANEAAAWEIAQFYDPTVKEPVYRSAANPHADWAAEVYRQWRDRSERHARALANLCASGEVQRAVGSVRAASLCP